MVRQLEAVATGGLVRWKAIAGLGCARDDSGLGEQGAPDGRQAADGRGSTRTAAGSAPRMGRSSGCCTRQRPTPHQPVYPALPQNGRMRRGGRTLAVVTTTRRSTSVPRQVQWPLWAMYPNGRDSATFWRALQAKARDGAGMRDPGGAAGRTHVQTDTWAAPVHARLYYQPISTTTLSCWQGTPVRRVMRRARCGGAEPLMHARRRRPLVSAMRAIRHHRSHHYVTSDVSDERVERYPPPTHGGNGRERYADVEAVRVLAAPTGGIGPLLEEAWARYGLPLAVTEVHLHAPREDQLRWLAETWNAACQARHAGIDVQAVTVWALLGSRDWDCLLTRCDDHYEPGAFEVRGDTLRPTAIARLATQLATGVMSQHPVLSGPGWWRRPSRLLHPPVTLAQEFPERPAVGEGRAPVLITGATGTLGRAFARICVERGLDHQLLDRAQLDIATGRGTSRAQALPRVRW